MSCCEDYIASWHCASCNIRRDALLPDAASLPAMAPAQPPMVALTVSLQGPLSPPVVAQRSM
ncbi:MAG: hypothetical protein NTX50_18830 [Candidatus Sumerlaeota bacterium]|nr:hypothetical protein [Candidatus Sumerlaeota bacterium]